MAENKPVAEAESTYLHQEKDLLTLTQKINPSNGHQTSPTQLTALIMAIVTSATALPILLFRIIPGFSSRITVIVLLVPFITFVPKPPGTELLFTWGESRHFLIVYFGALVFAALVI